MRAAPMVAMYALAGLLVGITPALADESSPSAAEPGGEAAAPVTQQTAVRPAVSPQPASVVVPPVTQEAASSAPGLSMTQPSQPPEPGDKSLVKQWWFWTALGAVVAGTVLTIVLVDRGPAAPNTNLGNREFQP